DVPAGAGEDVLMVPEVSFGQEVVRAGDVDGEPAPDEREDRLLDDGREPAAFPDLVGGAPGKELLVDDGHFAAVHRFERELVADREDLAVDAEDVLAGGVLDGVIVPEGEPLLLHHVPAHSKVKRRRGPVVTYFFENSISPFFESEARTTSPSANRPSRIIIASGFWILRWMSRLSGRAPNVGSKPSFASASRTSVETSSAICRSARRFRSRSICRFTIFRRWPASRAWKTTISSMRLRNSGRNLVFSIWSTSSAEPPSRRSSEPTFEVMM